MNQNYNTPVFILESDDNKALPSDDVISAAFKAAYPTYKEARLFALSGGVCIFKKPSSVAGAYQYSKFQLAGLDDSVRKVVISIGSNTIMVEYPRGGESDV